MRKMNHNEIHKILRSELPHLPSEELENLCSAVRGAIRSYNSKVRTLEKRVKGKYIDYILLRKYLAEIRLETFREKKADKLAKAAEVEVERLNNMLLDRYAFIKKLARGS